MSNEPPARKAKPTDPYVPAYRGFDEDEAQRVLSTVDRAKESEGAKGEDANKEYVDDGPAEYRRRLREKDDDEAED